VKRFALAFTVLAAGATFAWPSQAVIVTCANCSDLFTQLIEKEQQAQGLMTQAQQLKTELNQAQMMLQNTVALPQSIWANVQGDIMQVRNLANAASLLTGGSGTILQRLQQAGAYANSATFLPQNIGAQFTQWQTTFANADNSLARTLGVQQGQEQNYTALQAAIQAHSQTATGQMQAIQAGNESLGLINTQLQQVQTTLVAAAQETATRDEIAADRQAAADAQLQQFLAPPPLTTTGWPRY
jgi:type IV secretion system protein TrbJ